MKARDQLLVGLALAASVAPCHSLAAAAVRLSPASVAAAVYQGRSGISGHVFGESRRPLSDIYVELLDDLGVTVNRAKTEGSGRYSFSGLAAGRYRVRVLPYGTDYMEQVQDVEVIQVSTLGSFGGGQEYQADFYLRLRAGVNAGPFYAPGSVFAQEVPDAARKLYERAVMELREKREKEAFESLKRALETFPTYYLALERLGTEYVVRGHYEAARILLTKAVEVNPRGYPSVFGLGLSQYYLRLNKDAVDNLRRATTLYNKSPDAHLWLALALQRTGQMDEVEQNLRRAGELSQGKHPDVHWHMARIRSDQKRYKEAADELELFLKARPDARDADKIRELIRQLREKAAASNAKS